ncbi:MAG: DUF4160 domain-containing protein [Verrucomicrobiae bacterium]
MPTILRESGYRFMIFVDEPDEPAHVHVFKDDHAAKIRLDPAQVVVSRGFRAHEVSEFLAIIETHKFDLITEYERIHGSK